MKIKITDTLTDASLPVWSRDVLMSGANGGVKFLFDLAYSYSYSGATPVNGAPIVNINESALNGSVVIAAGQALSFAGGGIDFSAITDVNNWLQCNAAVVADIWGAGTGLQYFMQCLYIKLPTNANWVTGAADKTVWNWSTTSYAGNPDMLSWQMSPISKSLFCVRQTGVGTTDTLRIIPAAGDYGSIVQLAFWRNAAGQGFRLKSANGTVIATRPVNAANTCDFSAQPGKIGVVNNGLYFSPLNAMEQLATDFKIYRGFVENLVTSGRDPVTVLDADYARMVARNAFA